MKSNQDKESTDSNKQLIVCVGFTKSESEAIRKALADKEEDYSVIFKRILLNELIPVSVKDLISKHFNHRIVNSLHGENILDINDLIAYDLRKLWRIPGIGPKRYQEIETFLMDNGYIQDPIVKK